MCLGRQGCSSGVEKSELHEIPCNREHRTSISEYAAAEAPKASVFRFTESTTLSTPFGKTVYISSAPDPRKGSILEKKHSEPYITSSRSSQNINESDSIQKPSLNSRPNPTFFPSSIRNLQYLMRSVQQKFSERGEVVSET